MVLYDNDFPGRQVNDDLPGMSFPSGAPMPAGKMRHDPRREVSRLGLAPRRGGSPFTSVSAAVVAQGLSLVARVEFRRVPVGHFRAGDAALVPVGNTADESDRNAWAGYTIAGVAVDGNGHRIVLDLEGEGRSVRADARLVFHEPGECVSCDVFAAAVHDADRLEFTFSGSCGVNEVRGSRVGELTGICGCTWLIHADLHESEGIRLCRGEHVSGDGAS